MYICLYSPPVEGEYLKVRFAHTDLPVARNWAAGQIDNPIVWGTFPVPRGNGGEVAAGGGRTLVRQEPDFQGLPTPQTTWAVMRVVDSTHDGDVHLVAHEVDNGDEGVRREVFARHHFLMWLA